MPEDYYRPSRFAPDPKKSGLPYYGICPKIHEPAWDKKFTCVLLHMNLKIVVIGYIVLIRARHSALRSSCKINTQLFGKADVQE
jgi:hypothetical protein